MPTEEGKLPAEEGKSSTEVSTVATFHPVVEDERNEDDNDDGSLNLNNNQFIGSPPRVGAVTPDLDAKQAANPFYDRDQKIDEFMAKAGLEPKDIPKYNKIQKAMKEYGVDFFKEERKDKYLFFDMEIAKKEQYELPSELPPELAFFDQHGVPLESPTAVNNILKGLVTLSQLVPEAMELPSYNNKGLGKKTLIIQPTISVEAFKRQAKAQIVNFLDTIIGDPEKIDFQKVVQIIIVILGRLDAATLDQVFIDLAFQSKKWRIKPEEQMAMKEDANLSWEMLCVIKKHLIQAKADMLVPEYILRKQRQSFPTPIVMYDVDPETEERTLLAWWIHVDEQILLWLNSFANDKTHRHPSKWGEVHVVFLADHSQGSMKVGIRCIVFAKEDGKLIKEAAFQVGFVECKKDTREVMLHSVAPDLGKSMLAPCSKSLEVRMKAPYHHVIKEKGKKGGPERTWMETRHHDIVSWVEKESSGNDDESSMSVSNSQQNSSDSQQHCLPCQVFNVGDITYQLLVVLGRDGYSGYWCNCCDLCWADWQKERCVSNPLSHNILAARAEMIAEAEVEEPPR